MKALTCQPVRASVGAGVELQARLGRQHSDPRWSIFIRQSDAGLNSLQCEMCGSVSACMTAPCGTMGNNLTHRDNPLCTHSRCTHNTIAQNSHDAKHIMSLKWYLLSSETTHYPLPAQCSHNPQSLTWYRRSLQHELQARPTWREKSG